MKVSIKHARRFTSLCELRAMLVGFTLFVSLSAFLIWSRQHSELKQAGYLQFEAHFYPPMFVFLLLIGAIALWLGKHWSLLIALLSSGRLIYQLAFLSLSGHARAHDEFIFSSLTLNRWWQTMYFYQPQDILYLAIGILMFLWATILLAKSTYLKARKFL